MAAALVMDATMAALLVLLSLSLLASVRSSCIDVTGTQGLHGPPGLRWQRLDVNSGTERIIRQGTPMEVNEFLGMLAQPVLSMHNRNSTVLLEPYVGEDGITQIVKAFIKIDLGPDYCFRFTAYHQYDCTENPTGRCTQYYHCDAEIDSKSESGTPRMSVMDNSCIPHNP